PRLFRESPLSSIWEGSGNVAALDTLRAMAKQPDSVDALFAELDAASGVDGRLDEAIAGVRKELADTSDVEYRARRLVERIALVLPGGGLARRGDEAVAEALCASRLAGAWRVAYGTLRKGVDTRRILNGITPAGWATG